MNLLEKKRKAKQGLLEESSNQLDKLYEDPELQWLFFELTDACNLECKHCASSCSPKNANYLPFEYIEKTLKSAKKAYGDSFIVALTGGEPMLHPDFYKIIELISSMELRWGMTSNATLIGNKEAEKLEKYNLGSVSVSIDGLEETHDSFRNSKGSFKRALKGIKNLKRTNAILQITTVIHNDNLSELKDIRKLVGELGLDSWRVTPLDPVGRGSEVDDLVPSNDTMWEILSYIRKERIAGTRPDITIGCAHYHSIPFENEVRDFIFQCQSGRAVASVTATGDIIGCLDLPRIPNMVQGNISNDDFVDVWENRYQEYRVDFSSKNEECLKCSERKYCRGESMHTWDFKNNKPLICYKDNFNKIIL